MQKILHIVIAIITMGFCGYGAWHLFPKAFPLIHINLTTSRTDILVKAKEKIAALQIETCINANVNQTVSFDTDTTTKTFVELEGGGKKAFTEMIDNHYYEPYLWHVRFFVPYQVQETALYFTPDGTLYGFKETVSEDTVGTNLTSENALEKAFLCAKEIVINLNNYTVIESSQREQLSGRIDHSFVYERKDRALNEGTYRFVVTVSGNKVTECRQYIKIPEAFERKYWELRSYNNNLTLLGSLLMILLYILGGCGVALFLYTKQQLFNWKPALLCAGFIAFLHLLQQINQLPLIMMHYDTITGMNIFIIRQLFSMFFTSLISFVFFSLVIVVAEGLTRKAFSEHIQLWKIWKQGCANSSAVLTRTIGGYVLATVDLFLVVLTYLFTTHYVGWWNPSYALIDPNILATYIPALNTIALSLQAGFIEECLFRAIPLACAALLGNYFKKRRFFMIIGFTLQAFIFGAIHAGYPAQPFYARLAELIIPSFIWGIFYIRWGLLPIIICHVVYDIVWFSLPIFISHAAGIWLQKLIIIGCATVPLWIICYRYFKTKQWHSDVTLFLNGMWQESITEKIHLKEPIVEYSPFPNVTLKNRALVLLSSLFLMSMLYLLRPNKKLANLPSKEEITAIAHTAIASQTAHDWDYIQSAQPLPFFSFESEEVERNHQLIWQMEREWYTTMLEKGYITLPGWAVRYAHFNGDVLKRAEQAIVRINRNKDIVYIQHVLPQNKAGATLTEKEALSFAANVIYEKYQITQEDLALKSITPFKREQRTDWTIEYTVLSDNVLTTGETRVQVVLTGNTVELMRKYIHMPEQWQRQLKNDIYYLGLAKNIGLLALLFGAILFLSYIMMACSLPSIVYKYIIFFYLITMGVIAAHCVNTLPKIISDFNTIEPWFLQAGRFIGLSFILNSIFVLSTAILLAYAFYIQWPRAYASVSSYTIWSIGLGKGLMAGLLQILFLVLFLQFANGITLPSFYEHSIAFANSYVPFLSVIYMVTFNFLKFFAVSLLYVYVLRTLSSTKSHYVTLLFATMFGLPLYITPAAVTFFGYLGITLCCGLFFVGITFIIHTKNSLLNADKRADIGFITGLYMSNIYYHHFIQMVNMQELVGGFGAMVLVIVISVWFCKQTATVDLGSL